MAKWVFRDRVGLKKGLQEATVNALNDTLEECLNKLIEFIDDDIYSLPKSEWYERSEQIRNAFYVKPGEIKGLGISAVGQIKYRDKAIKWIAEKMQHGNRNTPFEGNAFFAMLNNDTSSGFIEIERRPFWDDFMEWCEENYSEIYEKNLQKYIK